jgi:hypothetical protein
MRGGYYLTAGQSTVFADHLTPRIDAVLQAFGLRRVAGIEVAAYEDQALCAETLVLKITVRRREAV